MGMWNLRALAVVVTVSAAALGCGGGSSGLPIMGMLGVPSPALVGANVLFVDAALNGHPGGRLLVDTGSPFTLVAAAAFPGATLPNRQQVTIDLGVGPALTIDNVPALQITTPTMDGLHLGGILGGNVLRQFPSAFDYAHQQLRLGDGAAPTDVEQPGASIGFGLQGGGVETSVMPAIAVPATRIPVTVDIEGISHPFVLDTGASEVTVRAALFAAVTSDGRAVLDGFPISTAAGPTTGRVSRLRSVTVAGEEVTNVPVLTIGDSLIDALSSEVGHPVDGLLGGSFLREFLVTIDYPRGTLHLQRYASRAHIVDEFQRVGIELEPDATGAHRFAVGVVYAGTDAQLKSLAVGDEVISIDGQALDGLDPIAADALLDGLPGTTKQIGLGQTGGGAPANAVVTVRVDDLVAVPPPAP
jgi:hypothetical protein